MVMRRGDAPGVSVVGPPELELFVRDGVKMTHNSLWDDQWPAGTPVGDGVNGLPHPSAVAWAAHWAKTWMWSGAGLQRGDRLVQLPRHQLSLLYREPQWPKRRATGDLGGRRRLAQGRVRTPALSALAPGLDPRKNSWGDWENLGLAVDGDPVVLANRSRPHRCLLPRATYGETRHYLWDGNADTAGVPGTWPGTHGQRSLRSAVTPRAPRQLPPSEGPLG